MEIRDLSLDEWGDLLPDEGVEPFHAPEALAVVDEYADGDLRLLGGFRGQQPVGLFPAFVREQWSLRFVLSPPPGLSVPRLGPILMPSSPKRRKQEKLNQRFAEGVLEAVDADAHTTLFGMVAGPEYADPRPYLWAGHGVDARFGYELDLQGRNEDGVLKSFSKSVRREIRKRDDLDVTVELEGSEVAERICGNQKERHAEQGLTFPTPRAYTGDLVDALGDRARVYAARDPDGTFLSGIVVLYSNETARFWQGGTKATYENVSVNSLLHWTIIEDLLADPALESVERYDLGSANNRRIARYKSKFDAQLVPHYEVKSDLMALAKKAYSIRRHLTAETVLQRL